MIAKVLASRLSKILPKLIHNNQKCIKGRKITDNIHMIQDIIDLINKQNWEAVCIMLDQEKAFDRISHNFIFKTLKQFGFGINFIKWIKILYTDVTSKVKVNGFFTKEFKIERGVRQGCPLSALLYVLCLEVLTTNIRKDQNIEGIKLSDNLEHKVCAYADDMNIITNSLNSVKNLFKIIEKYEIATNAKINKTKTMCLWLGKWKDREDNPLNLKWSNTEEKNLGVYIGNNRENAALITFCEIKEKMKKKISYWNSKYLSIKGKIKVINTFILPLLWYPLEAHDIPNFLLNDFKSIIQTFIWNTYHQRENNSLTLPCEQ